MVAKLQLAPNRSQAGYAQIFTWGQMPKLLSLAEEKLNGKAKTGGPSQGREGRAPGSKRGGGGAMDRWIDGSMGLGWGFGWERLGRGAERMRLEELLYLESPNLTQIKNGSF